MRSGAASPPGACRARSATPGRVCVGSAAKAARRAAAGARAAFPVAPPSREGPASSSFQWGFACFTLRACSGVSPLLPKV